MIRVRLALGGEEVGAAFRDAIALNVHPKVAEVAADHRPPLLGAVVEAHGTVPLLCMQRRAARAEAIVHLPAATTRLVRAAALARDVCHTLKAAPLTQRHCLERRMQAVRVERLSAVAQEQMRFVCPLMAHLACSTLGAAPAEEVDFGRLRETHAEAMVHLAAAEAHEHRMLCRAARAALDAEQRHRSHRLEELRFGRQCHDGAAPHKRISER